MIIIAILLGLKWHLIVLDCISLIQVILNFHMLISHFYIFLGSSVHFSIGLLVFYYWVLEVFFLINLERSPLSFVCVLVAQLCPTLCDPMDCNSTVSSMGFSRQEYWSGLPLPSPGTLPDPGTEPGSPALQTYSLLSEPPGKSLLSFIHFANIFSSAQVVFSLSW